MHNDTGRWSLGIPGRRAARRRVVRRRRAVVDELHDERDVRQNVFHLHVPELQHRLADGGDDDLLLPNNIVD